jgi:hypothetical protein
MLLGRLHLKVLKKKNFIRKMRILLAFYILIVAVSDGNTVFCRNMEQGTQTLEFGIGGQCLHDVLSNEAASDLPDTVYEGASDDDECGPCHDIAASSHEKIKRNVAKYDVCQNHFVESSVFISGFLYETMFNSEYTVFEDNIGVNNQILILRTIVLLS